MSSTTSAQPSSGWRGQPLSMGQLGAVLFRHWLILLLGLLLGAIGGFVVAKLTPPVYTATSTMLIKAVPGQSTAANYEAAQYAVARAKAYPVFIYNLSVLDGIRTDLGTNETPADLQDDLSATTIADTPLVQITAKGGTAAEARDKANAALREMSRFITQIETIGGKSPITVDVAVLAASKLQPTSPRPLLYTALGAVVGLALAIGIALIHGYAQSTRGGENRKRFRLRGAAPAPRHSSSTTNGWRAPGWDDGVEAGSVPIVPEEEPSGSPRTRADT